MSTPYRQVWLILWIEQETQHSGVFGVYYDHDAALRDIERLSGTAGRVFRCEQWHILT